MTRANVLKLMSCFITLWPWLFLQMNLTCIFRFSIKVQEFCGQKDTNPEVKRLIKEYEAYCRTNEQEQRAGNFNFCTCVPRFCDGMGNLKNWSVRILNNNTFIMNLILDKWRSFHIKWSNNLNKILSHFATFLKFVSSIIPLKMIKSSNLKE